MAYPTINPKTITLLTDGRTEEALASEAITPGHLLELTSTGKVQKHAELGGAAERLFATEDALQGNTIDDDYASGDRVRYVVGEPGDVVLGWLAGGEVAAIGSKMVSNGDGTLAVVGSAGFAQAIAVALEAKDSSDSSNASDRIQVRLL